MKNIYILALLALTLGSCKKNFIDPGCVHMSCICCLIFNYLSAIQTAEKIDPLKKQAIVIIDELDAHIHPSWQRKLIPILRKNFPNVQFIISAHSPLLIEGCKANEVSVLRRTSILTVSFWKYRR